MKNPKVINMGVNVTQVIMLGYDVGYESANKIQDELEEKGEDLLTGYVTNEDLKKKGSLGVVADWQNGEYAIAGLLVFVEGDEPHIPMVKCAEVPKTDLIKVKQYLKTRFNLDVEDSEIQFCIFTHYT